MAIKETKKLDRDFDRLDAWNTLKKCRVTITELSSRTGISQPVLSNIFSGRVIPFNTETEVINNILMEIEDENC